MAHPDPAQIRNVAVLGHRGSGKTSLVEAMLFAAGETNRLGSVAEGTTVADFDDDERRRTMSISAALCHLTWDGVKVNLIDTPGEPSFQGETLTALRAVDAALMVLNATAGIEVQTERLWSRAEELGLPRAAVINMLDRERADFDATMAALKELAPGAVAIQVPIGSEAGFRGVVNLVSMTATTYDAATPAGSTGAIPDDLADAAQSAREALIDVVAENDDALIEKYLEGEEITTEELIGAILAGVKEGRIFPVVCAAGAAAVGVDRALDLVTEALPSPADAPAREAVNDSGETVSITLSEDDPVTAFCFKTLADQFSGRINLLRVISGTLPSDSHATCARTGGKERIGQLFTLQGKDHVPLQEIGPGDIGAVAKLKDVATGDVLTDGAGGGVPGGRLPASADELRRHRPHPGRRGQAPRLAAAHDRRGPDPRRPPRRADGRLPRGRPLPDARRGDRRAHRAPLRRRHGPGAAPRALPRDRHRLGRGRGQAQEAERRARPVRRLLGQGRAAPARRAGSSSSTRSSAAPSRGPSSRRSRRASSRRCARAHSPATRWSTSG